MSEDSKFQNTVDPPKMGISMKRRTWIALAAVVAVTVAVVGSFPSAASAQPPTKPVLFLCGYVPGGTADLSQRMLAEALRPVIGQSVIVENRTGASGMIAAKACADASPEDPTLYLTNMGLMTIYPELPGQIMTINVDRDLTPISNLSGVYNLLVVSTNAPFKTVPELIEYGKKNPGKLTYGSAGIGTSQHLSGELFKRLAGIEMLHVPYRGGAAALQDVVNGRVQLMFGNMPELMGQIRGGKLRPIGFGGYKPSPLLPDVPLISKFLPEYRVTNWFGVVGPRNLSPKWVAYWNEAINKVAKQPKFIQQMTDNSIEVIAGPVDEFKATIAADRKRWGELIRKAGIRAQ